MSNSYSSFGLMRLTIRGRGFCESDSLLVDHKLPLKLLVDGDSLARRLVESVERVGLEVEMNRGGRVEDSERLLQEIFKKIRTNRRVSLVVQEQSDVLGDDSGSVRSTRANYPARPQALLSAARVIRSYANQTGLTVYKCHGRIYDRVAHLSRELQCPILTDDGQLFAKAPKFGMIPWDSLRNNVDCKIYKHDNSHHSCEHLDRNKLALINSLVRNRLGDNPDKCRIIACIRNRMVFFVGANECRQFGARQWNERTLASIWSHLCNKTYEEAKEYVIKLADECDQPVAEEIVDEGLSDLEFDQTATKLRAEIEDICGCSDHQRDKLTQWTDLLCTRRSQQSNILASMSKRMQIRSAVISHSCDVSRDTKLDRRAPLLGVLYVSADEFDKQLELHRADLGEQNVEEFCILKYLLNASSKLSSDLARATLSSFVYYSGFNNNFVDSSWPQIGKIIHQCGHKLKTPLKSKSACVARIISQIELLIDVIGAFNELNEMLESPMQRLRPEKWLNPCLIYNLAESLYVADKEVPTDASSTLEFVCT